MADDSDSEDDGKVVDLDSRRKGKGKGDKPKAKKGRKAVPSLMPIPEMPSIAELFPEITGAQPPPLRRGKRGPTPILQPTVETLRRLATYNGFQLTQEEAAACFGVSTAVFKKFLADTPVAREAWETGQNLGKVSVKRAQFVMAHVNVTAAIWWGKQHLGQSDKVEQTNTVTETSTTVIIDANAELQALRERVGIGKRPAITIDHG